MRAGVLLLVVLAALGAALPVAAAAAPLDQRISRTVRASGLRASTGVLVWDVSGQRVLYRNNPDSSLAPASNQKLVTTAGVLHALGPNYRLSTRIALRGHQVGSTWHGNIYLIGGGDPWLSTRGFSRRYLGGMGTHIDRLAFPLAASGITRIEGKLVVDETFLDKQRYVESWEPRFRYDESPALGGLTVNQGYLAYMGGPVTRSPATHAGGLFRTMLAGKGITISGGTVVNDAPDTAFVIGRADSQPMRVLLRSMNRYSDNFIAEILLKDVGAIMKGEGSTRAGADVTARRLRQMGIDTTGMRILDGSGLAYGNRLSARQLGNLLNVLDSTPAQSRYLNASLARSGTYGTLRRRLANWPYRGRVTGKTGTLRHVSALGGFSVRASNGRRYGFVLITSYRAGSSLDTYAATRLQDNVASILVK